ncbi:MAG: hypothetical protein HYT43_02650 [Candidatus Taylorbacteria bacterium]|nr:hypothetical protein [Candidatus Taylorbacteria bacterium]
MNRMRLWVSAAIIALVILVVFALSVPHTRDIAVSRAPVSETEITPSVIVRGSFKKGVYEISGSIEAPNACAAVSASAALVNDASGNESIAVSIEMQEDSGICLQAPTRMLFQTSLSAPANLPITATVNGIPADVTSP